MRFITLLVVLMLITVPLTWMVLYVVTNPHSFLPEKSLPATVTK